MQKKKGRQILAVIMATMMAAQSANAASWVQDYVGWWWQDNDNSYPVNQWREVNGAWYWFDDMVTWQQAGRKSVEHGTGLMKMVRWQQVGRRLVELGII